MSELRYEPRRVRFILNSSRDKCPSVTLKSLGLRRSPKSLIVIETGGPFYLTIAGLANRRGDAVYLRFGFPKSDRPLVKAPASWGEVEVMEATAFSNWALPWVNVNMLHLNQIPPQPDEIPVGWALVHDPRAGSIDRAWLTRADRPNPAIDGHADLVVCDCGSWPQLGRHYCTKAKEGRIKAVLQDENEPPSDGIVEGVPEAATAGIVEGETEAAIAGVPEAETEAATAGIVEGETEAAIAGVPEAETEAATAGIVEDETEGATAGTVEDATEVAAVGTVEAETAAATAGIVEGGTEVVSEGIVEDGTEAATVGIVEDESEVAAAGTVEDEDKVASDGIVNDETEAATASIDGDETEAVRDGIKDVS
jgi:hypothetical protein